MAKKNTIAIIGMSNFSLSVIDELINKRQLVTVFDNREEQLELSLSEYKSVEAIVLDSTNKNALAKNGISSYDGVIVSIPSMEESLLTVLNLIDLKCETIIVHAIDQHHKRILISLGLSENQIIIPDIMAGSLVGARSVFGINLGVHIQFKSIDDEYLVVKLVLNNTNLVDRTIQDAGLSTNRDFNIIQLKRAGKVFLIDNYTELKKEDELLILTKTSIINKLADKIQGTGNEKLSEQELHEFEELETIKSSSIDDDITFFNSFDDIDDEEVISTSKKK